MSTQQRNLAALLGICAVLLIVEASFGLCTQDDAFISFRYAQNFVDGHGLVFNPGERVEGISNFLWTVLFVPVIGLGLDPAPISISFGMLASVGVLWATWRAGGGRWLAVLLVAAMPGLSLEGVQGLETVFFAFLVTIALHGGRGWSVVAGIAALTRPEGVAVFGVLWLMRRGWRDLAGFAAVFAPFIAFRMAYYGDIVPNTFHAKVGGLAIERGLIYAGDVAWTVVPLTVGFIAGLVALVAHRVPREKRVVEAAVLALAYTSYVVMVGGDFKGTGRFLIPVVPAVALVAQEIAWRRGSWRLGLGVIALGWAIPGFVTMSDHATAFGRILEERRAVGIQLAQVVPPDGLIAIHSAGIVPYYSRRPTLDMWGINDAHIARATVDMGDGTAGHERHDYAYVLDRAPDVIVPERNLVTAAPVDLGHPDVFGPGFSSRYRSVSLRLESGVANLWRRID